MKVVCCEYIKIHITQSFPDLTGSSTCSYMKRLAQAPDVIEAGSPASTCTHCYRSRMMKQLL